MLAEELSAEVDEGFPVDIEAVLWLGLPLLLSPSVEGGLLQSPEIVMPNILMQGRWKVGSLGKPGNLNNTHGISGRFQRMIPPWSPPQLSQPTKTGTIVLCPPTSVVSHVLPVHMVLVVASVENPGGTVVIVDVIIVALGIPPLFEAEHPLIEASRGGQGGGGGKGISVQSKLNGNAQPHPSDKGRIMIQAGVPAASVVEVIRVVVSDASEGTCVGV